MSGAAEKEVFTTGQVATICGVAHRTVAKWVDHGLLKGYWIPPTGNGAGQRRIRREDLVAFMRAAGMPLRELASG